MTQIDINELRADIKAVEPLGYLKLSVERAKAIADELADTAPLSREELETVLKDAGYHIWSSDNQWRKAPESSGGDTTYIDLSNRFYIKRSWKCWSFDYSAVSRRLLRDCGVIA